jgi:hypothetical protein
MLLRTRTHHAPPPAAPVATDASASSAEASTSAGTRAKSRKGSILATLSQLGIGSSRKKKERRGNAETPPPVPAAPIRELRRSPRIETGRSRFAVPGAPTGGEELSGEPTLRRAFSAPQPGERSSLQLGAHLVWPNVSSNVASVSAGHAPEPDGAGSASSRPAAPASPTGLQRAAERETSPAPERLERVETLHGSPASEHVESPPGSFHSENLDTPAVSPRTSTDDAPPQFDSSPDATPAQDSTLVESEIVEEDEIESDDDTRSDAASIGSGAASRESDPSAISRETDPVPTGRNTGANLLRDAHEERHQNPYHASTDTTFFGIRTTSHPTRPMTLRQAGPAPDPMPPATPAEAGTVAPPPSARPAAGLRNTKKLKAVKAFLEQFVPQTMRRAQPDDSLRRQTNVAAIVPALTNATDLNARVQSLFTTSGGDAGHDALDEQIRSALGSTRADALSQANRTELDFTHHMLIAERLSQVTGGDAGRALAAFDALRESRFLPFSTIDLGDSSHPVQLDALLTLPSGRSSRAQPQLDALSVAAKLASSPTGFEALLRTLQPTLPANRQANLRRLLEAVAKVEAERGQPGDIALHTITARGAIETNQSTLAQDVLHIESRALQHVGDDPHASLNTREKAAVFSWDNGFRERGPGTELAKVQGRLAKMGKYVQRASHLQDLRNVRFDRTDMVRSAAKVVDAKARILAMRAQQTIGRKKTPLTGLRKFGANNNFLQHPDDDVPVLDSNAKTAIKALRARYADIVADPENFAPKLQDLRSKALPEPVLREALLDYWESLFEEQQMRPIGNKLDNAALKAITQRIATRYGVDTEQTRDQIEAHLQRWTGSKLKRKGLKFDRVVSRELTLADLQKWADDVHLPMTRRTPLGQEIASGSPAQEARGRVAAVSGTDGDAPATAAGAAPASPTYLEETEFATTLRKALAVIDSSDIRPDDLTPDGLHRFTRTYLLEHNWGNPLVASNGGTTGINTSSISESIRRVAEKFSPVSVVPILDLKLSRSNNAVLSIGSTTHGGEIFIGTQRQKAGSVGAGVTASVGPGALKKILGQGTASAELTPLATETVRTRGVMVRALRPPKPDGTGQDTDSARTELVKFNDLVWSIAKGEHGALNPEQAWELIANQFFKSQTLSIGWQDQDAQTVHHTVNASAGIRIGHSIGKRIAGAFVKSETERTGVSVGYMGDLTTLGSNRRKEETGKHRLVRANYLWRFQQNVTLGATLTNPSIPASHAAGSVTASLASGPSQITHTFALDDRGFNATFRAIVKSGKLSEPYTLREFEERNAKAFVKFLNEPARHAQFSQVFKATYGLDNGEEAFDNFKKKAQNWAGPGQHYVTRYRIRAEDRKILDELAAVAHSIHERNPEDPMLSRIEQAMKARLEDEDSWIPSQTFTLEGQTARDTLGVNLGVQFSAQETVASDRELSAVVVPLPIANEWTRARRNTRPGDPSVRRGSAERTAGA